MPGGAPLAEAASGKAASEGASGASPREPGSAALEAEVAAWLAGLTERSATAESAGAPAMAWAWVLLQGSEGLRK